MSSKNFKPCTDLIRFAIFQTIAPILENVLRERRWLEAKWSARKTHCCDRNHTYYNQNQSQMKTIKGDRTRSSLGVTGRREDCTGWATGCQGAGMWGYWWDGKHKAGLEIQLHLEFPAPCGAAERSLQLQLQGIQDPLLASVGTYTHVATTYTGTHTHTHLKMSHTNEPNSFPP